MGTEAFVPFETSLLQQAMKDNLEENFGFHNRHGFIRVWSFWSGFSNNPLARVWIFKKIAPECQNKTFCISRHSYLQRFAVSRHDLVCLIVHRICGFWRLCSVTHCPEQGCSFSLNLNKWLVGEVFLVCLLLIALNKCIWLPTHRGLWVAYNIKTHNIKIVTPCPDGSSNTLDQLRPKASKGRPTVPGELCRIGKGPPPKRPFFVVSPSLRDGTHKIPCSIVR